ncbi:MAG: glycosyltransferase, partial [bacterium]
VEQLYSEKLVRLPVAMWNYTPWPNLPEPSAPPCAQNGYVTFGSMNNHAKLQTEWLKVWARVLREIPDSVLLIKSRAMSSVRIAEDLYRLFEDCGVSRKRIIAKGFEMRPNDHFLTFEEIDICLDSVPYNGTTTTFDALWMGVPVVTMSGELHVNRTSSSILAEMRMQDWVARDCNQFVQICKRHAADPKKLTTMRKTMRGTMGQTTLGNSAAFSRHFETALRSLWRDFCSAPPGQAKQLNTNYTNYQTNSVSNNIEHKAEPEISIVVCASNHESLECHKRHVTDTVGVPFEYIGIDNSSKKHGLAQAYNLGGIQATSDVIVFVHDDVFFTTKNWGSILLSKFKQSTQLGMIGLAGTAYLQSRHPYWVASKAPFIHGRVIHHGNQLRLSRYSGREQDQPVVAIDGLMMAVRRKVFAQHQFDPKTFDGFHFYDLDFSLRVSETDPVIVTQDILVKHLSSGRFDQVWEKYRDRFRRKYPNNKVWSSAPGSPKKNSHQQRLNCHHPLDTEFDSDQIKTVELLGIEHPKHPGYISTSADKL